MALTVTETKNNTIPDISRRPLEKARKQLALLGLAVGEVTYQDSAELMENNIVLSQSPKPGGPFPKNGRVNITVFRKSYLEFLPGILQQEDERAGGLLRNYLWIVQHLMTRFQEITSSLPSYFNPHTTVSDFLPWLASWMAVELEEGWPEDKRRKFLANAVEIYKWRGTRQGLTKFINIVAEVEIEVEEHYIPFSIFAIDGQSMLGTRTIIHTQPRREHFFTVHMPGQRGDYASQLLMKIHRIIQAEKPAHTNYFLAFREKKIKYKELQPFIVGQTVLGEGWVS